MWLLSASAFKSLLESLLVLAGQLEPRLHLDVLNHLVKVVLLNFEHAGIDLDNLALVLLLLDGHLHHIGGLSLNPFVLFLLLTELGLLVA